MAHDVNEEFLFAGVVAVERFLRGDTRRLPDRVDARRQIALLKKEPLSGGADALACLFSAAVPSVCDDSILVSVSYGTVQVWDEERRLSRVRQVIARNAAVRSSRSH